MFDTGSSEPRRRRTDRGWRRVLRDNWYRDVWLLFVSVVVLWASVRTQDAVDGVRREGTVRTNQFCHLVNSTHADRVARYRHTLDYLKSPAGHERTLFNEYIRRVSLPQSRQEIRQEARAIPPVCRGLG